MLWLILALLVSVVLAAVIVGLVAVPARREGRAMLTERGEDLVSSVADRRERVAKTAKEKSASVARRPGRSDGDSTDRVDADNAAAPRESATEQTADTDEPGSNEQKTAG